MIIVILLSIIIITLLIFSNKYENMDDKFYENQLIVISRYNENLDWIHESPFNKHPIIIYNKGNDDIDLKQNSSNTHIIKLPNVGRESHTFLYHIIENYDKLSEITIFLVGSLKLPNKYDRSIKMIETVEKTNNTYLSCDMDYSFSDNEKEFKIDKYTSGDEKNKILNPNDNLILSNIRPFGIWFESIFKNNEKNDCFAYSSIFSISKENILQKPKSYYENLIKEVNTGEPLETGHYMERSWYAVFYPYNNDAIFNT